jgi:outer membrane protein assembly factor BamB
MSPKDCRNRSSRRKRNSQIVFAFIFTLMPVSYAFAGDWPRFRGPNGSGTAETSGLPHHFGPGTNMVWRTALPLGHSSPVLSGDRIFLTGADGHKLLTFCLSRETGQILWRRECPRERSEALDKRNTAASPSAVTDGKNIYVFFGDFSD